MLAAVAIAIASSAKAEGRPDSIADFDALAAQHNWRELDYHLVDIPPAAPSRST